MTAFNLVTGVSKNSHSNLSNIAESSLGSRFGSASARAQINSARDPNLRFVAGNFPLGGCDIFEVLVLEHFDFEAHFGEKFKSVDMKS